MLSAQQQQDERPFQAMQLAATLPEDVACFLDRLTDDELATVAQVTLAVHAAATTAQASRKFSAMWAEAAKAAGAPAGTDVQWPSRTTHLLGELVASMGAPSAPLADTRPETPLYPPTAVGALTDALTDGVTDAVARSAGVHVPAPAGPYLDPPVAVAMPADLEAADTAVIPAVPQSSREPIPYPALAGYPPPTAPAATVTIPAPAEHPEPTTTPPPADDGGDITQEEPL